MLLLLAPAPLRAGPIPWTYDWSNAPSVVRADGSGTGGITLSTPPLGKVLGDSDIVATNLRTFSTATSSAPDRFTDKAYTLVLRVTDMASGKNGMFTFSGLFNGLLTATSANIDHTFTGLTTQTQRIGSFDYTVAIGPFTAPGAPNASLAGGISAHVSVVGGGPPLNNAPEPTGMVLALVGAVTVGLSRWRGRRPVAA
jgi:hypothetical protein